MTTQCNMGQGSSCSGNFTYYLSFMTTPPPISSLNIKLLLDSFPNVPPEPSTPSTSDHPKCFLFPGSSWLPTQLTKLKTCASTFTLPSPSRQLYGIKSRWIYSHVSFPFPDLVLVVSFPKLGCEPPPRLASRLSPSSTLPTKEPLIVGVTDQKLLRLLNFEIFHNKILGEKQSGCIVDASNRRLHSIV